MKANNKLEDYILNKKDKVKISSKDINKGDIFIALKGKNCHGNKFLNESINKGAKFCITDNKNFNKNAKVIFVNNIFKYLTNLAIRKRNLYQGKIVGITGSAGKTTLKETLAFFLKKNYKVSFSKKSYNNELGVLISLLNINLNSKYSIFEIGTNNFGEIKKLTKIIQPSEIFITNIQSTHLENFRTKLNIAKEKSDIFNSKYNNKREKIYLNITNKPENLILKKAINEKNLKIICVNKLSKKYFIKKIIYSKKNYQVLFSINKKNIIFNFKTLIISRLYNLLFCYAFFCENSINIAIINKRNRYLRPVEGRGLTHTISFKKKKIKIIDESYNANPDTMLQSVNYFNSINKPQLKKILIIGNMNELGKNSYKIHQNLILEIDKYNFRFIILCGEFFKISIKKIKNPNNQFVYFEKKNQIMNFLNKKIHNNDIILIKCSNATEINKFTKELLNKVN